MIPKAAIAGIAIVGGAIVLIVSAFSGDNAENETSDNDENPKEFNAEEVRKLRRQLKKQMRLKKRASLK